MKFKVDLSLDLWLTNIEIEAKSKEAAQEELSRLVVLETKELINNSIVKGAESSNVDMTLVERMVTAKVTKIEYSVSEQDAEDNNMTVEEIIDALPKELTISVDVFNDDDVEALLTDAISDETGWLIESFKFDIIKEE